MKTILVVESNIFVQKMYIDSLQQILPNTKIEKATTFKDAEEMISKKIYDLYILGGSLDGGHSNSLLPSMLPEKVIVITGNISYYNDLLENGVTAFMKTFSPKKFESNKALFEKMLHRKVAPSNGGNLALYIGIVCMSASLFLGIMGFHTIVTWGIALSICLIITGIIMNRTN